jgi:imidazoleglycerol-phosphate dehydratase / histidinol-phosphatase
MNLKKILFIDRDGTLILEPEDNQVDSLEKFSLVPHVIPSLLALKKAGFCFVMVSNQDGLGSSTYPDEKYTLVQDFLMNLLSSQGIQFESIRICPHLVIEKCDCRKPRVGLVLDYLANQNFDRNHSYMIGDRQTDLEFAKNVGIRGMCIGTSLYKGWQDIVESILYSKRTAEVMRKTNETEVKVAVNLDTPDNLYVQTGVGFFDHLLEQLAKHGGFGLTLQIKGDLFVDDHHTIEDAALALGQAIRNALGDKYGVARYGFLLPMDEALAKIALDLSGRPYFLFSGKFHRDTIGNFSTELVPHFFQSFSQALGAALHIEVVGENTHHMIEAIFKGVGRALRDSMQRIDAGIPSTKGVL